MKLIVTDLSIARVGSPVLSGVSFALHAGSALVLRGPNGIGKTTLLRTLAGLQPALSGTINFPEEAGAYASHTDGIKEQLTVSESLAFWADVYNTKLPETVFGAFDLNDLRTRLVGTLSAGQKRRVGLARLGVIGRKILFLDEPTTSLDRFSVKMFAHWLQNDHLRQGGLAVIATHVDLGINATELELSPLRSAPHAGGGSDELFL